MAPVRRRPREKQPERDAGGGHLCPAADRVARRPCWTAVRTGASGRWSATSSPSRRAWKSSAGISARRHRHHRPAVQPYRCRRALARLGRGQRRRSGAGVACFERVRGFGNRQAGAPRLSVEADQSARPPWRAVSIAPAGRLKLDRISEEIRAINDLFFGGLDAEAFEAMRTRGRQAGRKAPARSCSVLNARQVDGAFGLQRAAG